MTRIQRVIMFAFVAAAGCNRPTAPTAPAPPAITQSALSPELILQRCVALYADARTMKESATIIDRRTEPVRKHELVLTAQRPDKLRIETERIVQIVDGKAIHSRQPNETGFSHGNAFTTTPVLTTAELACGGIRPLSLDLFVRGDRAIVSPVASWRLAGLDFINRRPCYLLACDDASGNTRQLWIDQDLHTLRRWTIAQRGGAGEPSVEATIERVIFDQPIDPAQFDARLATRTKDEP